MCVCVCVCVCVCSHVQSAAKRFVEVNGIDNKIPVSRRIFHASLEITPLGNKQPLFLLTRKPFRALISEVCISVSGRMICGRAISNFQFLNSIIGLMIIKTDCHQRQLTMCLHNPKIYICSISNIESYQDPLTLHLG